MKRTVCFLTAIVLLICSADCGKEVPDNAAVNTTEANGMSEVSEYELIGETVKFDNDFIDYVHMIWIQCGTKNRNDFCKRLKDEGMDMNHSAAKLLLNVVKIPIFAKMLPQKHLFSRHYTEFTPRNLLYPSLLRGVVF